MKHYILLLLCVLGLLSAKAQELRYSNYWLEQQAYGPNDTVKFHVTVDGYFLDTSLFAFPPGIFLCGLSSNDSSFDIHMRKPDAIQQIGEHKNAYFEFPFSVYKPPFGFKATMSFFAVSDPPNTWFDSSDTLPWSHNDDSIMKIVYHNGNCEANVTVVKDTSTPGLYYLYNNSYGQNLDYLWSFGDGDSSTLQFPSHTYASGGYYSISLYVSDPSGCSFYWCTYGPYYKNESAVQLIVRQGTPTFTGVPNVEEALTPVVFPNPATNTLNVGLDNKPADEIAIYDLNGKQLLQAIHPNGNQIDISNLANGMYVVQVKAAGKKAQAKWIKQ